MIIPIILFTLIVLFILNSFRLKGAFGLYIEVDIERQRMYGWYKGHILQSDSFRLDEPIENIQIFSSPGS